MDMNETNNSTTDDYDIAVPLVIFIAFIMSVLSIVGTIGNILVITAVYVHSKLRKVQSVFIINLAVADLIVTTIVIPFAIVGATEQGEFLKHNDGLCDFIGSLVVISCVTSVQSIAHIALNRYLFICFNPFVSSIYTKFYNRVTIPLIVTAIWLYAIIVDFPNFEIVGWGKHGYNHKVHACSFLYSDSDAKEHRSGYIWFLFVFGWGIPFVLTCYCYTRIYLFVRQKSFSPKKTKQTDSTITSATTSATTSTTTFATTTGVGGGVPSTSTRITFGKSPKSTKQSIKSKDQRLLKSLAIIFILFCLMWAPLPISGFFHKHVAKLPNWVAFLCSHLAIANSCINFIIYAFNDEFKEGYRRVWEKITCGKTLNIRTR